MTKEKRILFVALLFILGCFLLYQLFFKQTLLNFKDRNQEKNPAEEVTLSKGLYLVGDKIKPGFYDVFYESGKVSFNGIELSEGDVLLNEQIYSETEVEVEGKGKVRLEPSDFHALKPNDKGQIIINHSAEYVVGTDIPSGTYSFELKGTKQTNKPQVFVQILSSFNTKDSGRTYDFISFNKQQEVKLSKGEFMEVNKLNKNNEEDNSFSLILTLKQ
jgi:hypothetical protein